MERWWASGWRGEAQGGSRAVQKRARSRLARRAVTVQYRQKMPYLLEACARRDEAWLQDWRQSKLGCVIGG